jgi:ubiquinone/menaquinone biosynthesis C-methylase UbiE
MAKISKTIITMITRLYIFLIFGNWQLKDVFDVWYAGHDKSPTIRKIFRDVYADEYMEDVDASSYVTRTDLHHMVQHLGIGKGDSFVDLGCGRGGPGLWIARETGANLAGIDISEVAVNAARSRISDFSLQQEVRFQIGSFEETGLPHACYDGAMSVDALFLARDKDAAIEEVKRILCPGARFVFTSWEGDLPLMVKDHRRLLQEKGFVVEVCEETKDWKSRQAAVYQRIVAEKNTLIKEMGRASAMGWIRDAANIKYLDRMHRVLVVARKA